MPTEDQLGLCEGRRGRGKEQSREGGKGPGDGEVVQFVVEGVDRRDDDQAAKDAWVMPFRVSGFGVRDQ